MSFEFDTTYLIYLLVAASAGLFVEGIYLLFFAGASYRKNVNRRLKLLKDQPGREQILVQLRRERGLTSTGGYSIAARRVEPAGAPVRRDHGDQQAPDLHRDRRGHGLRAWHGVSQAICSTPF